MKILFFALLLLLFASCGQSTDSPDIAQPVDAWMPFVQRTPQRDVLDVRAFQPGRHVSGESLARQHVVTYEVWRINNFFLGNAFSLDSPDFFGGFIVPHGDPYVLTVLIVRDRAYEANEFLEYIQDFETVVLQYTEHSIRELIYISSTIFLGSVWPVLWDSALDVAANRVNVFLINYSDEEKDFFREYVIDSTAVEFMAFSEAFGYNYLSQTVFWGHEQYNPMGLPSNELDGVTKSAEFDGTFFVFDVYNETDYSWELRFAFIETYLNGKWVPIVRMPHDGIRFPFSYWEPMPVFGPGHTVYRITTENFTRHFEGAYRSNFVVANRQTADLHHLYNIFD